jgi:hypothetical protein
MRWNKNANHSATAFLIAAQLLTGAGCANEGTSADRDERGPKAENPKSEELPTEIVYRAEEGDYVFAVTGFEGEVFWMVREAENSPEYRLMSTPSGSAQAPSHLLNVDPETFDVWDDYVASSGLVVMDGDGVEATRLPHGEEVELLTEEGFSIGTSLDGYFVQNGQYVYIPNSTSTGSDEILRLDKLTLEIEVIASGLRSPNSLVLTDDVLYFVSSGADYDLETEVLTFRDQIFQIDLSSGDLTAVTDNNLDIQGAAVRIGDSLFYLEYDNEESFSPLMKVSLSDGSVSHVIDVDLNAHTLQTDGKRLYFTDFDVFVYSIDADGSNFRTFPGIRPWGGFAVSDGYLYVATGSEITRTALP